MRHKYITAAKLAGLNPCSSLFWEEMFAICGMAGERMAVQTFLRPGEQRGGGKIVTKT